MIARDTKSANIDVVPLGQAGFRLEFGDQVLYVDPYLSDNVEILEGLQYRRLVSIWRSPEMISDADWVLLTHIHPDHCDLETLLPLSKASPSCRFIAPGVVCEHLIRHGIAANRTRVAPVEWIKLAPDLRIHTVPAAHPRIAMDACGRWEYVGYVMEWGNRRLYHAGDTALHPLLFERLESLKPIDTAMLPVNEQNFFREQLGIVGNMSIRDAFGLARDLGVKTLVPMHWDMFEPNTVFQEEIELYYRLTQPPFQMKLNPSYL